MISTILAQARPQGKGVDYAREWFGRSDPTVFRQIMLVLGLIALGVLVAWLISRLQMHLKEPRTKAKPMRLFLRMQSRLGLSLLDRWRLWRLASTLDLRHPTALLISPALYDEAVTRYTTALGGSRSTSVSFAAIRSRLFCA